MKLKYVQLLTKESFTFNKCKTLNRSDDLLSSSYHLRTHSYEAVFEAA